MTRTIRLILPALLVAAAPGYAQQQSDRPAASVARVATGAALGSAGGLLLGALIGGTIGGNDCIDLGNPDSCRLIQGILIGSAVGATIGAPLGAHVGNRRRGNVTRGILASAAIGALGTAALVAIERGRTDSSGDALLISTAIAIPVLQIATSTWLERRTSTASDAPLTRE